MTIKRTSSSVKFRALSILAAIVFSVLAGAYTAQAEIFSLRSGVEFEAFVVEDRGEYYRVSFAPDGRPPIHRIYKEDIVNAEPPVEVQEFNEPEEVYTNEFIPAAVERREASTTQAPAPIRLKPPVAEMARPKPLNLEKPVIDKSQDEPVQKKDAAQREVTQFILQVNRIDEELNLALNRYADYLKQAQLQGNSKRSINLILDIIRQIEEAKYRVELLNQGGDTAELKQAMLAYYEEIIAYQGALLQKAVGKDSAEAIDTVQQAETSVARSGNRFEAELSALTARFGNQAGAGLDAETAKELKKWEQDRTELRDEYYFLISQVKELVEVNEALQQESERLIERNRMLEKELRTSIYRREPHKQLLRAHNTDYKGLKIVAPDNGLDLGGTN